jgi:hypothetical protein
MQHCSTHRKSAVAAIACVLSLGCSGSNEPELIPAGGVVNYQGRPLAGAKVTFVPQSMGSIAMATTDNQGKFELRTGTEPGIVAGPCAATVSLMDAGATSGLSPTMTPEDMQRLQMEGKLQAMLKQQQKPLIPEKYGRTETSGLNFEVKKGADNQFTLDLTD